nr:cache domain-containing protein [Eubacterium sp.]
MRKEKTKLKTKIKLKGLMGQLVLLFSVQIFIIVLICNTMSAIGYGDIAYSEVKEWLHSTNFSVYELFDHMSQGEYSYNNEVLKKGSMELTSEVLDEIKAETGVDVTIFWGDVRAITTIVKEDGSRAVGTTADPAIYEKVMKGESVFLEDVEILGRDYAVYYSPMRQIGSDEIVGMFFAGREKSAITDMINAQTFKTDSYAFLFMIIMIIIDFFILRGLIRRIKRAEANLALMAEGNLVFEIEPSDLAKKNEIGDICRSLEKLREIMHEMIEKIDDSASSLKQTSGEFGEKFDGIVSNINEIDKAMEEIAKGTAEQAGEAEIVSDKMSDLEGVINVEKAAVEQLNVSLASIAEHSDSASENVEQLTEINAKTNEAIAFVNEQTMVTNSSAEDIQKAIELITDITEQTNLLSLNASIEAARAGENGKGFAVVADQIRNLAEESSKSAQKISEIVQVLLSNSEASVEQMKTVVSSIGEQTKRLDETRTAFGDLYKDVAVLKGVSENISTQTEALDKLRAVVADAVANLAGVTEESAASVQETSASMQTLNGNVMQCTDDTTKLVSLSKDLAEQVDQFEI